MTTALEAQFPEQEFLEIRHPRVEFADADLARSAAPLPAGFLWGTATAAHQVEGGNTNDWTRLGRFGT